MNVLVLMSTYNGELYLREQLDSIRKQLGVNISLLIRDDGSNDKTLEIIESYQKEFENFNIQFISGENIGFAKSFTKLLSIALELARKGTKYDYYAFSDQDDEWLTQKVSAAVSKLNLFDNEDPNVYCSNTNLVDSSLNFIRLMNQPNFINVRKEHFLLTNIAVGCTMVFNYKAIWFYVSFMPSYFRTHDYLMFLIGVFIGNFIYDDIPYINYRQHASNQIGVSSNYLLRIRKRLNRIKRKEKRIQEKTLVAFLDTYKTFMDIDTIYLFTRVAFYRKNIWYKLSLFFSRNFLLNTFEKNFFLKLKILLGSL